MAGFLDTTYTTRPDYRVAIDGLQARLAPKTVYGFGDVIRLEPRPSLGVMGDRTWYADHNTNTEQVLDSVAADASHAWTHLIVTDGRRGDPGHAYGQFVRMRQVAQAWTSGGGTFIVAVSLAPFSPVKNDPSGCYSQAAPDSGEAGEHGRRCPLYAFAFAAPGDEVAVGATLAELFDHVWAYPARTAPGSTFALKQAGSGGGAATFDGERLRAGDSSAVGSVEADEPATQALRLRLEQHDTTSATGRLIAALLASGVRAELNARGVTTDSSATGWIRQDGRSGSVRVLENGRALDVFSPGSDDCRAADAQEPCGTLYRLEIFPSGEPVWVSELEAADAHDSARTFGLSRLFEAFKTAPSAQPLARAYLLVR
jgi:hypothetical protein